MQKAIIALNAPVDGPSGFIDKIELRPVTFEEYCEKGSPFEYIPLEGGASFEKIDHAKLLARAVDLADGSPGGQHAIRKCTDPRDFKQIVDAMRNFFHPATKSSEPTASSPSTPAGPILTSIA